MTMVQKVYSHLGMIRHRSEVVEYRVEQHKKLLGKRLEALSSRVVTVFVTVRTPFVVTEKPRRDHLLAGLRLTVWARVELNYRPHAYQACALTT